MRHLEKGNFSTLESCKFTYQKMEPQAKEGYATNISLNFKCLKMCSCAQLNFANEFQNKINKFSEKMKF